MEKTVVDLVHRIGIEAPAAKLCDAVATAQGVAGWWTRAATAMEPTGSELEVLFHATDGRQVGRMVFATTVLEPHRAVRRRFTDGPPEWIGTEATFEFTEGKGMTIVTFGHRGWREPVAFMALQKPPRTDPTPATPST